jgi:dihydroflavonol-4-reductase
MIFVTGGTGFLGSHLLCNLAETGKPVRALYRDKKKIDLFRKFAAFYPPETRSKMENIEWVEGDVTDFSCLMEYLEGVSEVYHAAGFVSYNRKDRKKLFDINIRGTANMVNASMENHVSRFCHVSSIAALGESTDGEPVSENILWNRDDHANLYSLSKFHGEMEVWRGIHEGLPAVIVNPSVIVGPGMWYGLSADVFRQVAGGMKFYPTGSSGYVDVRDVAKAMIMLTNRAVTAERFIVSSENLKHREVLLYLSEAMHHPAPKYPLTPFLIRTACLLESGKALLTGNKPRITMDSMKTSVSETSYANEKLRNILSFNYIPIRETVRSSVSMFLNEPGEK